MVTVLANETSHYKSLQNAAQELGVSRHTVNYYVKLLSLTPQKFLMDSNKYLTIEEFERIKACREEAAKRRQA